MTDDGFWHGAQVNVYRITPLIFLGAYPSERAIAYLRSQQIDAILNVSGGTVASAEGFDCLAVPFPDGQPIPHPAIAQAVRFIHAHVGAGRRVFVHCSAGQNRSPTIVWLYLLYTGLGEEQAFATFTGKTLDAVPGHPRLVGPTEVAFVRRLAREAI